MNINYYQLYHVKEYKKIIDSLNPERSPKKDIPEKLTYYYLWSLIRFYLQSDEFHKKITVKEFEFVSFEIHRLGSNNEIFGNILRKKSIIIHNEIRKKERSKFIQSPDNYEQSEYYNEFGFNESRYYEETGDLLDYPEYENDFDDETAIEQENII